MALTIRTVQSPKCHAGRAFDCALNLKQETLELKSVYLQLEDKYLYTTKLTYLVHNNHLSQTINTKILTLEISALNDVRIKTSFWDEKKYTNDNAHVFSIL